MKEVFQKILDWSEVWAPLIPLIVFIYKKPTEKYLTPVVIYLAVAACLDLVIDVSWKYKPHMPLFLKDNNFLYNIHSISRLFLFILFFNAVAARTQIVHKLIPFFFLILIAINFIFFDNFRKFSDNLFTFEAIVLLVYAVLYFLRLMRSDEANTDFDPSLVIITGIAIYEAINFFIFLFHEALTKQNAVESARIWNLVHNFSYIVFCLFIARAFYGRFKHR